MRIAEKSPLWSWREVCLWLFEHGIHKDKLTLENALFLSNINAVITEPDEQTRKIRQQLIKKIHSIKVDSQSK